MIKFFVVLVFALLTSGIKAQLIDIQYNYNSLGDCFFGAANNTQTPLFLHLYFENLENAVFAEEQPYVKKLEPGFTSLFTLQNESENDAPIFIFKTKTFRSNPLADVNLDFPYLIPLEPGTTAHPFDVKNIDGFYGKETLKEWRASGFVVKPGQLVYSARRGQIVEITGKTRESKPETWYNTWTNSITLLQEDGTLITYKNVVDKSGKLKLNQKIQAGDFLGEVASGTNELILLVYHNDLDKPEFDFIIPLFVISTDKTEILNPSLNIEVIHPSEVKILEMTKREQKKFLKGK